MKEVVSIKVIDNKKVEMTTDEYKLYQKICRSYDRPSFKGEELFKEHFESNNDGVIIFVKPPQKRYSSLEVFCFLISIMQNQHMRVLYDQQAMLIKETEIKINKLIKQLAEKK